MVAKGHDLPDVRLAAVLDADGPLRFPDFRSEERTFALVAQLAGRAGRAGPGLVIVQTAVPDARAVRLAAEHDAETFLAGELDRRRMLRYPPYCRLVRVVCHAESAQRCHEAAVWVTGRLRGALSAGDEILGPAELFRVADRHRWQSLIKASSLTPVVEMLGRFLDRYATRLRTRGVELSIDVDPQ
jgi:primosomal protein N' (replication factor Y)